MTIAAARLLAIATAVLGFLDPAFVIDRPRPVPVSLRIADPAALDRGAAARADAIRLRLADGTRDAVDLSGERPPRAVVVIGGADAGDLPTEHVPVSTISLSAGASPNVRLARIEEPPPAALRQAITTVAEFEAVGLSGKTSVFTLSDRGLDGARVEHRWTTDRERFRARFRYAPPSAGLHVVTVAAVPLAGEASVDDNAGDVGLLVDARPLRVLAWEPRPSWNATFVRRALEADPRFEVASLVRSSRGVLVRGGDAPSDLIAGRLADFDVVLAGAPEELRAPELNALSRFSSQRGGSVVFLPDRRPSGPYVDLLPPGRFEEALLENPAALVAGQSSNVRASELLIAHGTPASVNTVASIERSGTPAPVALTWTHGAGRLVLWGALDAWRFRAEGEGAFARFWQSAVGDLAVAAPPRVDVSASPRTAAINEPVTVRAILRATEFVIDGGRRAMPPVSASLVSPAGADQPVRLWPTAEPGVFEGITAAAAPGAYEVRVTAGGHAGRTPIAVAVAPRRAVGEDAGAMTLVAASTGGVAVDAGDLSPLEEHLRGLAAASEPSTVRPLRSVWCVALFAACLCAEWAGRRRRGLE